MPFLNVSVDGIPIATVGTAGRGVVSVHVGGTRVDDDYADLSVSGGVYEDDKTDHRIWVDHKRLSAGQVLEVAFSETGTDSGPGQTIQEIDPNHSSVEVPTDQDKAEMFAELRNAPMMRSGYTVECSSNAGTTTVCQTLPDEHGFGFSVLWNSHRPESASISVRSYTITSLENDGSMRYHCRERLRLGETVRLALVR
jgi:hypothetical protein